MGDLLTLKSSALANYDYNDIASGTGVKRFYGALVSGATFNTDNAILSDFAVYSGKVVSWVSGAVLGASSASPKLLQEVNYDVYFQKPQIIFGNGIVNLSTGVQNGDTNANTVRIETIAELRKIDKNSVVTRIVSGVTLLIASLAASGTLSKKSLQQAIKLAIPRTKMKSGETMRLSIIQLGQNAGSDTDARKFKVGFGTDPTNRTDTEVNPIIASTENTIFIFDCPFKINR